VFYWTVYNLSPQCEIKLFEAATKFTTVLALNLGTAYMVRSALAEAFFHKPEFPLLEILVKQSTGLVVFAEELGEPLYHNTVLIGESGKKDLITAIKHLPESKEETVSIN